MTTKSIISKLTQGHDLTHSEAKSIFTELLSGALTPAQIAAFLVALKMKGETEDEIAAAATIIRGKATKLAVRDNFLGIEDTTEPVIDTCGTGGSGINKFNVSTATAFVVSAAGIKVAKHGNKAISSNCGSADVLEVLGIPITSSLSVMQQALVKVGVGFLYAPLYHPALAHVSQIRKEVGVRTIFNILGPLCNPALASYQLLGVYDRNLVNPLACVLRKLSVKRALVVYGTDVGDEISLTGPTHAAYLNGKKINTMRLNPSDFGLKKIALKDILVKDSNASACLIQSIFKGKKSAARDMVMANASACFYILGKVKNFKDGVRLAAVLLDEGKVERVFRSFKEFLAEHA